MTTNTPAPYRPPMNWEERARRAEALAARLAVCLENALWRTEDIYTRETGDAALNAWTAHRADLDTLDGRDAQ